MVTPFGEDVIGLVEKFNPEAITLDIHLPDVDGWTVELQSGIHAAWHSAMGITSRSSCQGKPET